MASKAPLLLLLNILFFTLVSSSYVPCPPPPHKKVPKHKSPPIKPPSPKSKPPPTPILPPTPITPPTTPTAPITPPEQQTCPIDVLKLATCANVLGLVNVLLGSPANTPCCALLGGLVDLDAAVCLCTAIKADVLGINLNIPVSLSLLLNFCGKDASGFKCE